MQAYKARCACQSQKTLRLQSMQKYLAAQSVCFTFHIESSLLLASGGRNTAYLNAVKMVSSGDFKENAEKKTVRKIQTQPWLAGFKDRSKN